MTLSMADLCGPVGGYVAHLRFDPGALEFIDGTYTAEPFGLHVPLASRVTGEVALAATVDPAAGQAVTAVDAVLAELTFLVLDPLCVPPVAFRGTDPPSRLLAPSGTALPLQTLVVSPPSSGVLADINGDAVVDVDDLLEVILQWGPCPVPGGAARPISTAAAA